MSEELDLVAIAEREVIERAKEWAARIRSERPETPFDYAEEDDLYGAVVLLTSREQVRDQIEAEAAAKGTLK